MTKATHNPKRPAKASTAHQPPPEARTRKPTDRRQKPVAASTTQSQQQRSSQRQVVTGANSRQAAAPRASTAAATLRFSPPAAKSFNLQRWIQLLTVEKCLTLAALVVAASIFMPFATDLVTGWPFHWASILMDVAYTISSFGFGVLCWKTYRGLP